MKITFVNLHRNIFPPLGICYLSSYVKQFLLSVNIVLLERFLEESRASMIRRILNTVPDIVGFSTYSAGFSDIISIAQDLKLANPRVRIWLGGPHITSLPHALPWWAEVGVIGEGEETFRLLCIAWARPDNFYAQLPDIQGICFHQGEQVRINPRRPHIRPLDTIPPPDLSLLDMLWYTRRKRFFIMKGNIRGFVLLTSRGCPYRCTFCQAAVQWGDCRYHSAERVVSELEQLRKRFPDINAVNIIDDLFVGDRRRLRDIVSLIQKRQLADGLILNVNARANLIDDESLRLLQTLNVKQISYGFESNSDRILNFLKKGSVTVQDNQRAVDVTNAYGIGVGAQFMMGTPGETDEDIRLTADFIKRNKFSHAHLSITVPMPGTELWELCKQRKLVSEDMDWRRLDFGNPQNDDLLYVNECLSRNEFSRLVRMVRILCDRQTGKNTLADYWYLFRSMTIREVFRVFIKKIGYLIQSGPLRL